MSWRKHLRDIALAGGLAGGCTAQIVGGGTGTTGSTGTTGATGAGGAKGATGTTGTTGAGAATGAGGAIGATGTTDATASSGGPPPCNANPDPCCLCSNGYTGEGGYGGASCVSTNFVQVGNCPPVTCQDVLDCTATPTAACCGNAAAEFNVGQAMACQKAGFSISGGPCASSGGTGGGAGAGGGSVADGGV